MSKVTLQDHCPMPNDKWSNGQMVKWPNGQMVKWSNGQMVKRSNAQTLKCSNAQMLNCSNASMLKNLQILSGNSNLESHSTEVKYINNVNHLCFTPIFHPQNYSKYEHKKTYANWCSGEPLVKPREGEGNCSCIASTSDHSLGAPFSRSHRISKSDGIPSCMEPTA